MAISYQSINSENKETLIKGCLNLVKKIAWHYHGRVKNIIEIGSGTGSLIEQIGIKEITAVELSSTARDELIKKGIKTYTTINELNTNTSDLIFGNEILDNIPCSIGIYLSLIHI